MIRPNQVLYMVRLRYKYPYIDCYEDYWFVAIKPIPQSQGAATINTGGAAK